MPFHNLKRHFIFKPKSSVGTPILPSTGIHNNSENSLQTPCHQATAAVLPRKTACSALRNVPFGTVKRHVLQHKTAHTVMHCMPDCYAKWRTLRNIMTKVNKRKEGVSNFKMFGTPSFSFCMECKFFKQPYFERFSQIFDFSHIKSRQCPYFGLVLGKILHQWPFLPSLSTFSSG